MMAALPLAPSDLRLNQRLAALHTRAARFAEAGVCCRTLQSIYSEAGYPEEATRYGELADRYEDRSSSGVVTDSVVVDHAASIADEIPEKISIPAKAPTRWPADAPESVEEPESSEEAEFAIVADPGEHEPQATPIEASTPAVAERSIFLRSGTIPSLLMPTVSLPMPSGITTFLPRSAKAMAGKSSTRGKANETIEEIRFYLEHGMPEHARQPSRSFRLLLATKPSCRRSEKC